MTKQFKKVGPNSQTACRLPYAMCHIFAIFNILEKLYTIYLYKWQVMIMETCQLFLFYYNIESRV